MDSDDGEKRNKDYRGLDFHIRMSADEKELLLFKARQWASRAGDDSEPSSGVLSKYARSVLLAPDAEQQAVTKQEIIDFKDKTSRLAGQIAKVGVNLNQVARVANAKGIVITPEVARLVQQMKPLLKEAADLIHDMMERNL
ncbi:plasmid mobilization relaxosome protein MobC [Bifidobacterium xylocopae]|uniref:Bacterial mobilisation domain-containing protein n=1 Tax=Bifidobacterium xylocopae TaxID=2493119 RepID=A0A366KBR0_9BIFI|nr:plasmid mobilization relaxosome protein MobC [Bifidobacterium xylocopae]RBP98807.1 hypothetical protein CRD59_07075 [Bifidobacterium xylocopae]